jgi:glutaredoxin
MRACENHNESIIIFNGDVCPFCKMEKNLKTIREEVEKTMAIMKQIQMTAKEAELKSD